MSSRPHIEDFLSQTSYGIEVSGILSLRLRVSDAQRLAKAPALFAGVPVAKHPDEGDEGREAHW
jgi:hypothetical protein